MDAQALLDEANDCHDDDPARGAALLRQIDATALTGASWPLLGFLINHVFGERLGDWAEAHARQGALANNLAGADGAPPAVMHRHAAVAARLAGDTATEATQTAALAAATGAAAAQAAELVALAAASLQVGALPAGEAGRCAMAALAPLDAAHWQSAGSLDVAAASQCNNLGNTLVDRPLADLADPALREALAAAPTRAAGLWQRAGNWVHHERAGYLCALAASALGDAAAALQHASDALALIDAHDAANEQSVDRAFLMLEASFALERLGRSGEASSARATAEALAAAFGDVGLATWFADRVTRNEALRG